MEYAILRMLSVSVREIVITEPHNTALFSHHKVVELSECSVVTACLTWPKYGS